ncbi:MAG: carbamoyltransferase N-terminal domain-containing protein, partial [Tumebacillaceae bacterium]
MYILGINCAYHESAAALLKDGQLIAAVEEERFSRIKHGKPSNVDNADELPLQAIRFCLEQAGIEMSDVGYVGCSMNPEKRLENQHFTDPVVEGDWGSKAGEELFYQKLMAVPGKLAELGFQGQFQWISHHLCHAASAYFPSPFDKAAVLAVDGIGETASTLLAIGEGNKLTVLAETPYPASLGFLWEKMAKYLGFSEYDACKVMGLAAFGEPEPYMEHFRKLVTILPDGQFALDNDILCFRVEDYSGLETLFGVKRRSEQDE